MDFATHFELDRESGTPLGAQLAERLEQLRPLAAGIAMGVATIDEAPQFGIDTEDDLLRANARWGDGIDGRTTRTEFHAADQRG